ncbi:MAG TPA: hypothetical protein VFY87_09140, partial [Geminicoccaceae bacterium]|nr:hypothetical protein [Geminicoccaceae bacterium]
RRKRRGMQPEEIQPYSLTISMICSSVNRLVRICPSPERRSNRFSLAVAPFQGAGSNGLRGMRCATRTRVSIDQRSAQSRFQARSFGRSRALDVRKLTDKIPILDRMMREPAASKECRSRRYGRIQATD